MTFQPFSVLAPAKVNLYLHVTGKRNDGYHTLDSLVGFTNIGDKITLEPANEFSFRAHGAFANSFTSQEIDSSTSSRNLVVRAVHALASLTGRKPHFRITLTKNLPLASGIGGGSADAAATIWALMTLWNIPPSLPGLDHLMIGLGADVPACLPSAPVRMTGIGETLDHVHGLPEMPIILINPLKQCPTPDVFRTFNGPFKPDVCYPAIPPDASSLIDFLNAQGNDLTAHAVSIVPDIEVMIQELKQQSGCRIARMSGSGATVFGLFDHEEDAVQAAEILTISHPRWWIRTGSINSPARY